MALTDYKPFQTVKINSYTQLDIVPHSSIEAVAFEKCADPKETLGGYYSSKEKKPQIMINGGLFNMSTGHKRYVLCLRRKGAELPERLYRYGCAWQRPGEVGIRN